MPKVYLTESQKDHDRLCENLRLVESGRSCREMAVVVGLCPSAYCKRRKKPEQFTYEELRKLCKNSKVNIGDFVGGTLSLKGEQA